MERHALRDDQFARIEQLLPGRPGTVGRDSELGNRLFVDAVIWKFRVGTPWRDLPERFGGWCNTHKRFSRWAASDARRDGFVTGMIVSRPQSLTQPVTHCFGRGHAVPRGGRAIPLPPTIIPV